MMYLVVSTSYKKNMRICHCADLHLDSKMTTHLTDEQAKERKNELLHNFIRLVDYVKTKNISAVIIAGDLFDKKTISVHAKNIVFETIRANPNIKFYYLQGNHDLSNIIESLDVVPENLFTFKDTWTSYIINDNENYKIVLTGIELENQNSADVYSTLFLQPESYNIVTMHGQLSQYGVKDDAEVIDLSKLKNKNIDYLALGHIHQYQDGKLDARGSFCYPGCLEGRGYDETGDHGFVVIDINEKTHLATREFIPFAMRKLYEIPVDVSNCNSTSDIIRNIEAELTNYDCKETDLVKFVLTGEADVKAEKDLSLIVKTFNGRFYCVRAKDHSKIAIDYESYSLDTSLKGEFVRLIKQDESIKEDDKREMIRCALQVLNGEEIEL
ncbi:metallophosphoesterase family protein [[Clostridium] aminophilum]|nr:metallophosphoesterase [[Clostridium] aminophilum]